MLTFALTHPGCGNNPFRLGDQSFYGPGLTVDTTKPFTVVTQFIGGDDATNSSLSEIRRMYIQDGNIIQNPMVTNISDQSVQLPGTVTEDFCTADNASDFLRLGGMQAMGESLARGMVLIFSLWNSDDDFMNCTNNAGPPSSTRDESNYLDADTHTCKGLDSEGAGPCAPDAGDPADILKNTPELSVTFSNIKVGDIGSTFNMSALTLVQAGGAPGQVTAAAETQAVARGSANAVGGFLSLLVLLAAGAAL